MTGRRHSRRSVLIHAGAGAAALLAGCAAPPPAPRATDANARDRARTLAERIDRLTWGANESSVALADSQGFDHFLQQQLRAQPEASLPAEVQARIRQLTISRESLEALVLRMEQQRRQADGTTDDEARKQAQQAWQQEMNRLAREAASRQLLRALHSPEQVRERMTWFWLNHFSVHQYKHNLRAMIGDYEETIRTHALGSFRQLVGAVARHPAMLRYLDNEQNAASRLNENFARELMELHTLGVDAGYSQADVQELARVLTGVGVNLTGSVPNVRRELQALYVRAGVFEFNPNRHDFGAKQLLGRPIASRGLAELDEALDRLTQHPAAAPFICRKLALYWFSEDPPPALIAAMSQAFRSTGGDISRVLGTLFAFPGFWEQHKFKDPMRYVVSAVRAAYDDRVIRNTQPLLGWLARLGESPYGRPTPDGYPLDARSWSSAGQMAARFEVAKAIGSGSAGLFRSEEAGARDLPAFPQLATPLYYQWRADTLSPASRNALAQATSPQEWNTFLLASPEFMQG